MRLLALALAPLLVGAALLGPSEPEVTVRAVSVEPARGAPPVAEWISAAGPPSAEGVVEQEAPPPPLIELSLARSPWPPELWPAVVAIAWCESKHVATDDTGDGGLAWGLMQIRIDAHPDLHATYNLLDADDNLTAAWIIYLRAGGSFAPWSCTPGGF